MANKPENPFANQPPPEPRNRRGDDPTAGRKPSPINRFTPFVFTGTGRQLFGIQFLNILLIVLTLGVWTPWARVRKRRFFYNNTRILGDGLDYLATGFDLFKGWIVVTIVLLGFYALPVLGIPFLQEGASLVLLLIYPWALNRSLRFNARNLAWRDVRFDYNGGYFGSLWFFFVLPLLGFISLGILMPLASKGMREYMARRHSFGAARFSAAGSLASYYGAGFKTVLLGLFFCALVATGAFFLLGDSLAALTRSQMSVDDLERAMEGPQAISIIYAVPLILFFLFIITGGYYRALTRNIIIGSLRLQGGVRFRSHVSGIGLAWIILSNLVLSVATLGLLMPWAQVRQYRYLTSNTEIRPIADMQSFVDRQSRAGSSIGDAVGEAGGLEINF